MCTVCNCAMVVKLLNCFSFSFSELEKPNHDYQFVGGTGKRIILAGISLSKYSHLHNVICSEGNETNSCFLHLYSILWFYPNGTCDWTGNVLEKSWVISNIEMHVITESTFGNIYIWDESEALISYKVVIPWSQIEQ